jgi:hypothetical protein
MSLSQQMSKRLALGIVLITGALLGLFVWYTTVAYVPHHYALPFKHGQWLVAPGDSPQGYFRHELLIAETVTQAWVTVTATDTFVFYLNGKKVAARQQSIANVSGQYDVTPYLRPGKNVLGVEVVRVTAPGAAKMALEGVYVDKMMQQHLIVSNASWKVAGYTDAQNQGRIPWYTETFQANAWPSAAMAGIPTATEVARSALHPAVMSLAPQGKWLGHSEARETSAVFATTFSVAQKPQGAWLRMAAEAEYDLTLNGTTIVRRAAFEKTLDIYDIGAVLRHGVNTLQVRVSGRQHTPPRLLLDGVVVMAGQPHVLVSSDASWTSQDPKSATWSPAVALADYAVLTDNLAKKVRAAAVPMRSESRQTAVMLAYLGGGLLSIWLLWWGSALLSSRLHPAISRHQALVMDALVHLPSLVFLAGMYLLQYDLRVNPAIPFQEPVIALALAVLLLLKGGLLLEAVVRRRRGSARPARREGLGLVGLARKYRVLCLVTLLLPLLIAGLLLRFDNLRSTSLTHDETSMVMVAQEIGKRGYPVKTIGPVTKPLTTYELLPYPIALSTALWGLNDTAARLPALVLAACTMLLIGYVGTRLWGTWSGILAAAIYALSPIAILWGSNAFHPQQAQLFVLLTSYLFYRAITPLDRPLQAKYLYGAAGCFIGAYLSWEGTGLLLPALFVGLLVVKGRDTRWVRCSHLWLAVILIVVVVGAQMSHRILSNVPYIVVGKGLSGATFTLAFLDPMYDPWFYVQNFLLAGTNLVLTLVLIAGLPFLVRHPATRYYGVLLLVLVGLLTNLLPNLSVRYIYFALPFMLLPAAALVVMGVSALWQMLPDGAGWTSGTARGVFAVVFPALVLCSTNTQVLHLYRLGSPAAWSAETLPEIHSVDYRATHRFLKNHIASGDVVVALMPHTLEYYGGLQSDYYLQAYTSRQIFYDVSESTFRYLDKYNGSAVVRNLSELTDVLHRHRRVWIVAAPYGAFLATNDAPIRDYIQQNTRVVYESYKTRVFLWER